MLHGIKILQASKRCSAKGRLCLHSGIKNRNSTELKHWCCNYRVTYLGWLFFSYDKFWLASFINHVKIRLWSWKYIYLKCNFNASIYTEICNLSSQSVHYFQKQFLTAVLCACGLTAYSILSMVGDPFPSMSMSQSTVHRTRISIEMLLSSLLPVGATYAN